MAERKTSSYNSPGSFNRPGESYNIDSSNMSTDWNQNNFSQSANGLLESLDKNRTFSLSEIIISYYRYYEEYLLNPDLKSRSGNNHVTWLLQLRNYPDTKIEKNKLRYYVTKKLAEVVIQNVKYRR